MRRALALDAPIVARAGDRFVIRGTSPVVTLGGGVVSDPLPPHRRVRPWPRALAALATRFEWVLTEAAGEGVALSSLPVRLGEPPAVVADWAGAGLESPQTASAAASRREIRQLAHRPASPGR